MSEEKIKEIQKKLINAKYSFRICSDKYSEKNNMNLKENIIKIEFELLEFKGEYPEYFI